MAWYSSWTRAQRLVITVPSGTTTTLSYFPIVLTASSLPTELTNNTYGRSDGGDLAFAADLGVGNSTSSIGAQIPCEVVSAVFGGSPAAEIHVQVPSVAATGTLTYIWVLYGNAGQTAQPAASSTYGSQAVWNENGTQNYQAVWHFGTPSTLSIADSTSNAVSATNHGVTATTGAYGGGANFDGSSYIDTANFADNLTAMTVSAWLNYSSVASANRIAIAKLINFASGEGWCFGSSADKFTGFVQTSGSVYQQTEANATIAISTWYYVVWTKTSNATSGFSLYINSGAPASVTNSGAGTVSSFTNSDNVRLGTDQAADYYLVGLGDEFRIASVARSASWIAAEYSNQSAPGTFIAPPGGQGPLSLADASYTFSASGLAISGVPGGAATTVTTTASGLAISGAPGGFTLTAGGTYTFSASGLAISGAPGGVATTVTTTARGLAISGAPGDAIAVGGQTLFFLPYEFTSLPIQTSNANPFDIDPEQTTLITTGMYGYVPPSPPGNDLLLESGSRLLLES